MSEIRVQHVAARQKRHAMIGIRNVVPHELRSIEDAAVVSSRKVQKLRTGASAQSTLWLPLHPTGTDRSPDVGLRVRSRRSEPASPSWSASPSLDEGPVSLGHDGQLVVDAAPLPTDGAGLHPAADPYPLDDLILEDQLLPIGRAFEQQLAARVDASALDSGHEDSVVGMRGTHQLVVAPALVAAEDSATPASSDSPSGSP